MKNGRLRCGGGVLEVGSLVFRAGHAEGVPIASTDAARVPEEELEIASYDPFNLNCFLFCI